MPDEATLRPVRVIVVANEKGGSGKSTVAMHIAIALLKRGLRVATVDLDTRQQSLTHYIDNRRIWAARAAGELEMPRHLCLEPQPDEELAALALANTLDALSQSHDAIVIDTPGHDGALMRRAHAMADLLITPLNDSFVDLDALGSFDPEALSVTGTSQYARTVEAAQVERVTAGRRPIDWIVMRNRLSMTPSHNKRMVGAAIEALSQQLGFRCVEGLAERVVFREFFLRGLTAFDRFDETTLGKRPTMSHVTARQEVEALIDALNLGGQASPSLAAEKDRDAA